MLHFNTNFEVYSVRGFQFQSTEMWCWQTASFAVRDTPWKLLQKSKSLSQPSRVTGGKGWMGPAESPGCLSRKEWGACSFLKHALNIKQGFTVLLVSEIKTSLNWSLQDWMTAELERSMAINTNSVVKLSTASYKKLSWLELTSTGSPVARHKCLSWSTGTFWTRIWEALLTVFEKLWSVTLSCV